MSSEPKLYEISYLLRTDSAEESGAMGRVRKYLEDKKGMITDEPPQSKKRLSYPIEKQNEAIFGNIKFFIRADEMAGLKDILKEEKDFLRYLLARSQRAEIRTRGPAKRVARRPEEKKEAADIETIDKKLEEILGS